MSLVFNPFTGTFDFTGSSGGGGGTITGTGVADQLAFWTGSGSIGGAVTQPAIAASAYTAPALAGVGAGNVSNGTHRYVYTWYRDVGAESAAGTPTVAVAVVNNAANGQVTLTVPYSLTSFLSIRVYRDKNSDGVYKLVGTTNSQSITYVDNVADGSLGATAPSSGTLTYAIEMSSSAQGLTTNWLNPVVNNYPVFLLNGRGTSELTIALADPDQPGGDATDLQIAANGTVDAGGKALAAAIDLTGGYLGGHGGNVYIFGGDGYTTNGNVDLYPGTGSGTAGQVRLHGDTVITGTLQVSGEIVAPTIASFANATHSHLDPAGGGTLTAAAVTDLNTATITFTNKSGNISQWTNDSGYLTSVTAHNVLSATHGDTLTDLVVRGDVIIGNSTPKWSRLAIGSSGKVLTSNGTDVSWQTPAAGTVTSIATTSPISGGTITSTGTISLLVNTDFLFTANQSVTKTVGVTSADGLMLVNSTAAAAGAQQWSPRLRLTGQGWKTTATAASQTVDWILETVPIQGTTTPTTTLVVSSQVNGAGYVQRAAFQSAGGIQGADSNSILTMSGGFMQFQSFGTTSVSFGATGFTFGHTGGTLAALTLQISGGATIIACDAANSVSIRNATAGQALRIYNTFTDASNYERLMLNVASNIFHIGAANAGTGTARALQVDYGGTTTSAISIPITSGAVTFGGGITLPGGATFLTTNTALTDGVGASAGTITNAPSVGNPTKWIGISDNGVTRYIPAW